ncbi:MAG TPA: DUF4465 domain-containing protein [Bacteroidales bacterium]|nr:DUF4465 domain-containing protein [Bacteroidales bacterium]
MNARFFLFATLLISAVVIISCQKEKVETDIVDFEELPLDDSGVWNGSDGSGGFRSGNIFFVNHYNSLYQAWSGFAYTNHSDTVTGDYTNQYSSITGSGFDNSLKYGVFYFSGIPDTIVFEIPEKVTDIALCNTTFTYKAVKNGTVFSKKFGGDSGNDPDWLKVTLTPISEEGIALGYVDVYLADFRYTDNKYDYISNVWISIDLSQFGFIKRLKFEMSSSDSGEWGMNTPAYVCIDNIKGILAKDK